MKKCIILLVLFFTSLLMCGIGMAEGFYNSPDLVISRPSIAYTPDGNQVDVNEARTTIKAVAGKVDLEIDTAVTRTAYDIDGNKIICKDGASNLYYTTPSTFPNYTHLPALSGLQIQDIIVVDVNVWLVGISNGGVDDPGTIKKTIDGGQSWQDVTPNGLIGSPIFGGGFDKLNNKVVFTTYNQAQQDSMTETLGEVYLSEDAGDNWAVIFDPNDLYYFNDSNHPNDQFWERALDDDSDGGTEGGLAKAKKGLHGHFARFIDANTIIISYGDSKDDSSYGDQNKIVKLIRNGASWDWEIVRKFADNPAWGMVVGDWVYMSKDGGFTTPLERYNHQTNQWESLIDWWDVTDNSNQPHRYKGWQVNAFGGGYFDYVYYVTFSALAPYDISGILASSDGEHWTWIYRKDYVGYSGGFPPGITHLVGSAGGYIWGSLDDINTVGRLFRFKPPRIKTQTVTYVEKGVTNVLSADMSSFESGSGSWILYYGYDSSNSGRKEAAAEGITAKSGSYVWKWHAKTPYTYAVFMTGDLSPKPDVNDYIYCSAWIYAKAGTIRHVAIKLFLESPDNLIPHLYNSFRIPINQWVQISFWTKCLGTFTTETLTIYFQLSRWGAGHTGYTYDVSPEDWNDVQFYWDNVQLVYDPDLWNVSNWQIGGTARADETATATLTNLDDEWSAVWIWHPELSKYCIPTDGRMDLAYLTNGSDEINLYFDNTSDSEGFVFADADDNVLARLIMRESSVFLPSEIIWFGISHRKDQACFYVQTAASELRSYILDEGACSNPTSIVFGTSQLTGAVHSAGAVSGLTVCDRYLNDEQMERFMNLRESETIGDITGEGDVNFEDLKVLAEQWLQPPGNPSADIAPQPNGDNIVNFLDFALLAENWLK